MSSPHSPTVDAAEVAKFDAASHRFWDPQGEFKPLHRLNPARTDFVAERTCLDRVRVLDVGCGGGLLSESLARRGARVRGIDMAPGMIEIARLHALESGLAIEYETRSAEQELATGAGAYDVVTCMEMLEHVPEPSQVLQTLASLVRPGGDLFVSTLHRNLRAFALAILGAEYVARLLPRGTHEYDKFIRPSELARAARAAGLQLRELAGIEYNPMTEQAALTPRPEVNYLAWFRREAATA